MLASLFLPSFSLLSRQRWLCVLASLRITSFSMSWDRSLGSLFRSSSEPRLASVSALLYSCLAPVTSLVAPATSSSAARVMRSSSFFSFFSLTSCLNLI